jgi:hypothetical protein
MKKLFLAGAVSLAAIAAPGSAAVVISNVMSSAGSPATDPGYASLGQTLIYDFDTVSPAAGALSGDYQIATAPGTAGVTAAPSGTPAGEKYLTVPISQASGSATLDLGGEFQNLSFYWGSVDTYNTITLFQADGSSTSVTGSMIGFGVDPNGNQTSNNSNVRVNFTALGRGITSVRFDSTQFAFETDTFAGTAVPEPSTWAMMLGGFGLLGFAARRRSSGKVVAA